MSLSVIGRPLTIATTASWAAAPPSPIWLATKMTSENNNACTNGILPTLLRPAKREPQHNTTPFVELSPLARARLMVLRDRLTQNPSIRCYRRVDDDNGR